jgi:hypothetical protein
MLDQLPFELVQHIVQITFPSSYSPPSPAATTRSEEADVN